MTIEQFDALRLATPFRPFRIHMADGRHFDIRHRDFLSRSPAGRTVIVYRQDDTFEVLDLLLMSSIEVLNGRHRTRRTRA